MTMTGGDVIDEKRTGPARPPSRTIRRRAHTRGSSRAMDRGVKPWLISFRSCRAWVGPSVRTLHEVGDIRTEVRCQFTEVGAEHLASTARSGCRRN